MKIPPPNLEHEIFVALGLITALTAVVLVALLSGVTP